MSVLEGGTDPRKVFPVKNPYGDEMREIFSMELDGATDIAVNETGDTAYIAGNNVLYIFDIKNPGKPLLLSKMQGIGRGRQIEVQGTLAFVTSRPDGLFIIDVGNPAAPRILCHYDTIELATGVWVSGNLCFIACRHLGVEIINISDPENPVHLSNVLSGEAQSVFVDGEYMYVGAWMNKEVRIFDISDPGEPKYLSACPLDGFGDGIFVRDNICFAATGHHSRKLVNRRKYAEYDFVTAEMLNEGYGGGHGMEIFDVTDKKNPRLVSRIKTPPLFLSSNDMWDVIVSGNCAFLADTYNGLFAIDVRDLEKPFFIGYKRLKPYQNMKYLRQPSIQQPCEPVNGIAVIKDHVLVVSAFSGLYVIEAKDRAVAPPVPSQYISVNGSRKPQDKNVVFQVNGHVHALVFYGEYLVTAAGSQGLYVLDYKRGYAVVCHKKTRGFAMDIKCDGRYLYVAEGKNGFSVWVLEAGELKEISRYKNEGRFESVRQVVLFPKYSIAALHIGVNEVAFIDISNAESIFCRGYAPVRGVMYYKSIVDGLFCGQFAAVAPLSTEPVWYDLQNNCRMVENCAGFGKELCPIEEGIAVKDDFILTVLRGKYYISRDFCHKPSDEDMVSVYNEGSGTRNIPAPCGVKNDTVFCGSGESGNLNDGMLNISGRPKIIGNVLCIINRMTGEITLINIEDVKKPVLIEKIKVEGTPEDVLFHEGAMWIPCGHGGLYRRTLSEQSE